MDYLVSHNECVFLRKGWGRLCFWERVEDIYEKNVNKRKCQVMTYHPNTESKTSGGVEFTNSP